jgi:hypothetical protein
LIPRPGIAFSALRKVHVLFHRNRLHFLSGLGVDAAADGPFRRPEPTDRRTLTRFIAPRNGRSIRKDHDFRESANSAAKGLRCKGSPRPDARYVAVINEIVSGRSPPEPVDWLGRVGFNIAFLVFFFFVRLTVQNTEFRHGLVAQHLSLMTRLPGKLLRSCCIMADMAQSATPGLTRSFPGCVVISRLDTDPNVNFFRHDKHAGELIDRGGSEFCSRLPSFRLHQLKQIPPPSHEYTLCSRHFL